MTAEEMCTACRAVDRIGLPSAKEQLFKRVNRRIENVVLRSTSRLTELEREEVVITVGAKLLGALLDRSDADGASMCVGFQIVVRNRTLDFVRKKITARRVSGQMPEDEFGEPIEVVDPATLVPDRLEQRIDFKRLGEVVRDPVHRKVLEMMLLGYGLQEIADEFGVHYRTAQRYRGEVRAALTEKLDGENDR